MRRSNQSLGCRSTRGVPAYREEAYAEKRCDHCLFILTLNEGERLHKELARAQDAGVPKIVDIVLLDGGSTDGSIEKEALRKFQVNTLLTIEDAGRQAASLRMGFHWALERGYKGILTIDGNNKDSIEDVPRFLEKLEEGYGFVQGSRYREGGREERTPWLRKAGTTLLHAPAVSIAAHRHFTDTMNAFRAYSATYLSDPGLRIFRRCFQDYEWLGYLASRASQLGYRVCEVPVTRVYPKDGSVPTKIGGGADYKKLLRDVFDTLCGRFVPRKRRWPIFLIGILFFLHMFYLVGLGHGMEPNFVVEDVRDASITLKQIPTEGIAQNLPLSHERLHSAELYLSFSDPDTTRAGKESEQTKKETNKGRIKLQLYDEDLLVWSGSISAENIKENDWNSIYLGVPRLEENKPYRLQISADGFAHNPLVGVTKAYSPESEEKPATEDNFEGEIAHTKNAEMQAMLRGTYRESPMMVARLLHALPRALGWLILLALLLHFSMWRKRLPMKKLRALATFFLLDVVLAYTVAGYRLLALPIGALRTMSQIGITAGAFLLGIPVLLLLRKISRWIGRRLFCDIERTGDPDRIRNATTQESMSKRTTLQRDKPTSQIHRSTAKRKWSAPLFCLGVSLCILIPAAIILYAFNPLITTYDTTTALQNAEQLYGIDTWISVEYILMIRLGRMIWNSLSVIALEQWALWTFVWLRVLLFLRKKGIKEWVLLLLALAVGVAPCNSLLINTGWKDIPYTACLLWLALCVAKLVLDSEHIKENKWFYIELGFALFGVFAFRKNGIVPFLAVLVLLVFAFRNNKKRFLAVGIALGMVALVHGPVYAYLDIHPTGQNIRAYTGIGNDLIGTYYDGGELPKEALNFVTQLTKEGNIEYEYDPTYFSDSGIDWVQVSFPDFLSFTAKTIVRNPATFAQAALARHDLLLGTGIMSANSNRWISLANYTGEEADRAETPLTERLRHLLNRLHYPNDAYTYDGGIDSPGRAVASVIYRMLFWRGGLYTFLAAFSIYLLWTAEKRREALLLGFTLFFHTLGIWLSSGYGAEFRFYWPCNVLAFFLLLCVPVALREKKRSKEQEEKTTNTQKHSHPNEGNEIISFSKD